MIEQKVIESAVSCIMQGGVIAYPTESSFGLGCAPNNLKALRKILSIKARPAEKGLIILVNDIAHAEGYIQPLNEHQLALINQARARATTWLIPRNIDLPVELCGTHSKIAVRITKHPIANAICEGINMPLVSTSCNLAGKPPLNDPCAIKVQMGSELDLIVPGELGGQPASQIIDLETGQVLRQ